MKAALILLACVCAVAVALPAAEVNGVNIPVLEEILLQAGDLETVRIARQSHHGGNNHGHEHEHGFNHGHEQGHNQGYNQGHGHENHHDNHHGEHHG